MRTAIVGAGPAAVLAIVQAVAAASLIGQLTQSVLPVSPAWVTAAVLAVAALTLALSAGLSTLPFAVLLPDPLLLA
ncbi:hypothetical protein J8J40_31405, partial [Mycobacterium tuberculosis]|nr:hypothetical protein [Mycobacterium tuberculosis]